MPVGEKAEGKYNTRRDELGEQIVQTAADQDSHDESVQSGTGERNECKTYPG